MIDRELPIGSEPYTGPGRVLRVKEGYNPNSSSLGSVVFTLPAALVAAPMLLAGVAAWIAGRFPTTDATEEALAEDVAEGVGNDA